MPDMRSSEEAAAAYVKAHMNELDNVAGEVVVDSGIGAFTSMATGGRKDVDATLTTLLAPFPEVKVSHEAELGTDNYDFMVQGVPTFVPNQLEANYLKNYHATSDTFDKVDLAQLKKHVAMAAWMAYGIANAPERIAQRQSRAQVEELMKRTGLEDQIKLFGGWDDWEKGTRGRVR